MRLFEKLLFIFCLFVSLISAQAQYRFDSWTTDEGLPQNSVLSVIKNGAVTNFDEFSTSNKRNPQSFYEDRSGRVWTGFATGGGWFF